LNPVISDLYNGVADVVDGFSEFTDEHPQVTAGITAVTTVLGIGAAALTGYTVVTKIATAATKAFSVATKGNAIFTIITGVTAAVGAFKAFTSVMDGNKETVEDYDGTLEECRSEIELTERTLANARERYNENSNAVQTLESNLDTLNKQYEQAGGYLQELYEQSSLAADSIDTLNNSVKDQNASIDTMEVGGLKAVTMLEKLSGQSDLTNTDLDLMSKYADYLNDTFNCNIEVDYDTGKLTGFDPTTDYYDIIDDITAEKRKEVSLDFITNPELLEKTITQNENLLEAQNELDKLKNKYGEAGVAAYEFYREQKATDKNYKYDDHLLDYQNYYKEMGLPDWNTSKYFKEFITDVDNAEVKLNEMQGKFDETKLSIQENCDVLGMSSEKLLDDWLNDSDDLSESVKKVKEAMTPEEAISEVWAANEEQIKQFAEEYEEAYDSI
ncbi:MAG: hypothetical protein ACLUFX_12635, partial [Oscillospiraceae bacterium]